MVCSSCGSLIICQVALENVDAPVKTICLFGSLIVLLNYQGCGNSRSAMGMGIPMGMGIEIPSPQQPWTLPWVWGSP